MLFQTRLILALIQVHVRYFGTQLPAGYGNSMTDGQGLQSPLRCLNDRRVVTAWRALQTAGVKAYLQTALCVKQAQRQYACTRAKCTANPACALGITLLVNAVDITRE